MAEAVVSIALETLRDLLLEEAKFLSGVSSEVKGLEKQLKEIKCLLEDADKRQHESKFISNWIAEIRDLAHRSEDAIETYAFEIASKTESGFRKLLGRFSCVLNDCFSLHQIGSEISEIKSEIARIKESMKEFGIKNLSQFQGESSSTANHQRWKRQTYPTEISEDCFVGKDDDLKQLVSLIVDDKQHRVISIWGMGGIGKTTIARKVYNHTDSKRSFECFAWVCITQQCQIRSVLEDVLKQLIPQKGDHDISSLSDTQLIQQLCRIQETKRCMVVLDDLWEVDHWDALKHGFLVPGSNSKVLVTTRKQNVADMGFAFELGLLNIDDGWELLKNKAFLHNNDIPDNSGMEENQLQEVGKKMVRKCGFLPLVISILGGVLSRRKSMEEWESVNENLNAHLYREEDKIHGVLNLSYEDLPFYLKPCFLYMGQFREDEVIKTGPLYCSWIAEGMISHENKGKEETLMDVAQVYLSELASRCLLQVQVSVKSTEYYSCQLHDAVRELCLSKGKKEGFSFQVMNYRGGEFSSLLNELLSGTKPRHLAIHFEGVMASKPDGFTFNLEDTSKHVRSLQFLNEKDSEKIEFQDDILDLEKCKLLKVLVFRGFRFKRKQLRGIGKLIHLRHLALKNCELDEFPSSISNLKYLHTLDLKFSFGILVPNVLKNMHRLKYLILPYYHEKNIGNYHLKLEGLDGLELLYRFNSLVHDLEAVIRIKNLLYIDAEVHCNKSLLAIINACNTKWTKLRIFDLSIMRGCQLTSTEEGLVILKIVFSCQILSVLTISVPIRRLQLDECVGEIINSRLVYLHLYDCQIEDDPIGILEKFPVLENLHLRYRSFVGEEMKCHVSGFPRLRKLLIERLPNLREWIVEEGAMPLLSEIEIKKCPRLEMIPDGLRFTLNLQKLTITGMPELGKRIDKEEGQDFHKVRHVPAIIILD